tara:strand:- start:2326 stop:3057 length:732 start_codon:yes stop_codon:yes gene_type:complete
MSFDISNFENKICFIGYNKTATTSIDCIFKKNAIKTSHNAKLSDLKKVQVISDTGSTNNPKLKFNYEAAIKKYPGSICVLNTRSLEGWLISRCKHYYWRGIYGRQSFGYPITKNIVRGWIESRNDYYQDLLHYFLKTPEKLLILDIDKPDWAEYMCNFFNIEHFDTWVNKSRNDGDYYTDGWRDKKYDEVINQEYLDLIKDTIYDVCYELGVKDSTTNLLIPTLTPGYKKISTNLKLIENNFL